MHDLDTDRAEFSRAEVSRAEFLRRSHVSRETLAAYDIWLERLIKWNSRINLVAPQSLTEFWTRHALDSWQICQYLPDHPINLVDFGSGAGFPALSAALHFKASAPHHQGHRPSHVHLVESVAKKASFLNMLIRELALPATVHNARIEAVTPVKADIITARAFAPLDKIFEYSQKFLQPDSCLILLKGENAQKELEKAAQRWTFELDTVTSMTHAQAHILIIRQLVDIKC